MKYYIKVITGFREDQHFTLPAEEAHKAYWLFSHPEERGIFSNGVALIGKNIQGIEPDFRATMGWNQTHELDSDDFNEMRKLGVDRKVRSFLEKGKETAYLAQEDQSLLQKPLEIEEPKKLSEAKK